MPGAFLQSKRGKITQAADYLDALGHILQPGAKVELPDGSQLPPKQKQSPWPDAPVRQLAERNGLKMDETAHSSQTRNPTDLIAGAIEAEKKAAWFYTTMAEMTSDGVARETLRGLADDEISHARTLTDLYVEITGHGVTESPSAAPEGEPNFFDFPSVSRRAALEFALQNEVKAADLYQTQAGASDDPSRAEIFSLLAETERKHAAYIRLQLRQHTGWIEH